MANLRHGRIEGLDGLRGIAAVSVMLFHYTAWYPYVRLGDPTALHLPLWLPRGHLGVELFFVISGFVIFMTLERTPNLYDFLTARFARLYPAFVASMVATLLVTGEPVSLQQVAGNLTMVPLSFNQMPIDGSYWTLAYELTFYLTAALCFLVMKWRTPELPCAIGLALELTMHARYGANLASLQPCHLFVIGIMLYRLRTGRATPLTAPLLAAAIAFGLFGRGAAFQPLSGFAYAGWTAAFAALVWLATTSYGWLFKIAPLRFLGRVSYPLYLVHQTAGFAVLDRLRAAGFAGTGAVALTIAASIVLAWAISTAIEWPAQRGLRQWFANRRHYFVAPRPAQALE